MSTQQSSSTNECNESSSSWRRQILTKDKIVSQGNKIRLVDSDQDTKLDLYCYVRCTETSDASVKSCRGTLTNGDSVIIQTYGYTPEYTVDQKDEVRQMVPDLSTLQVYDAHEGALLRVFFFGDKWYVATHRKLDAFRSKWASRQSFGEQFLEALESEYSNNDALKERLDKMPDETQTVFSLRDAEKLQDNKILSKFLSSLDNTKCYCFLVRNSSENRIVCKAPERPTLYQAGTFSPEDKTYFSMTTDICIPTARSHQFANWDELWDYVANSNEDNIQGVIMFTGQDHIKILGNNYKHFFNIRGNEPSIKFRYLQLRMNKKDTDDLYGLYPRQTDTFEEYENILYQIAKRIYNAYVERFIKKKYVTLPKEEYQIMRACHAWHMEDRPKNRISLRKVIEKMNEQTPTNLNKMIRHVLQDRNETTNESTNETNESTKETEENPEDSTQ